MRILCLLLLAACAWSADSGPGLGLGPVPAPANLPPSGAAGGGLGGTYPNPNLAVSVDNTWSIQSSGDATKVLQFALSGATTATTLTIASSQTASRTLTIPPLAGNDTVATLAIANSFTAAQTIGAGSGTTTQLTLNSTGANAYMVINAASTFLPAIYLEINGTAQCEVYATTAHPFNIVDQPNSVTFVQYTPGAISAGFTTFSDTTASTTTATGAVVITGGLGVGGAVYAASMNLPSGGYNLITGTADGSVACVFTAAQGPAGASTAIQGWETFKVAGVTHYRPYW